MSKPSERRPPRLAIRFLQWFCPPSLYESVQGDLTEAYIRDIETSGDRYARRRFILNVLQFFRPEIILRNSFTFRLINNIMLGNYLKVAARNIGKRKLYSFINAFGLSIAIAFCILIYLFIQDERSFDQFHANKDRIYRIEEVSYNYWRPNLTEEQRYTKSAYVQAGVKQAFKDELPEVQYATRFNSGATAMVKKDVKVFTEELTYVDNDFFLMFSFPLLAGNPQTLLKDKSEVVITPQVARKYFGDEDPIGRILSIDDQREKDFVVSGIIEAPPANSSLDFSILVSEESRPRYENQVRNWGSFNTPTLVQLAPDADPESLKKNTEKILEKYMGRMLEDWRREGNVPQHIKLVDYEFTALPDWHLKHSIEWHKVSNPQYSAILGGIAILILLIACINYISLALTTSAARRTEVGIRKVVGAVRNQLIYQFGFESVLLAMISLVVGVGLTALFLPGFNEFTGKAIAFAWPGALQVFGVGIGLALLVGVLAGSYPAFFLSGFRPAEVLKGRFTSKVQAGFTKPLVVLQFALSAFLIITSVIMYRQMRYITTKDLGYDQHQVVVVPTQTGWMFEGNKGGQVVEQFRTRLLQHPDIVSVAGTNISFNQGWSRYGYRIDGESKNAYVYTVDPHYLPTLNMQLVEGRNFDAAIAADTNAIIVNEALVRDMKWTNPLEERLNWMEDSTQAGAKVIGVIKDYHYRSLEAPIEPLFLCMDHRRSGPLTTMMIRIEAGNIPQTLKKVSDLWKELFPDKPYVYTFLDEDVARQYRSQERWMRIVAFSTGFAILISCLGLFGLAGINAVNRTKEIGIRKVMGAGLPNIFVLLNRQYIVFAGIAFVVAIPFSWYGMNKWWLADFQYRITVGWELFAISMLAGVMIAMITVSYHAIKTAMINPADTLKYE